MTMDNEARERAREVLAREVLGRFGFHPDPAIDFCCEVDAIEGEAYDVSVGAHDRAKLLERIDKAMTFRVGGDVGAIDAKHALRQVGAALKAGTGAAYMRELIAKRSRPAPKDQPRPIETGEVIQADRDAAAEWCASQPFPSKQIEAVAIAAGEYDHHSLVQAFARHRIAAQSNAGDREALEAAIHQVIVRWSNGDQSKSIKVMVADAILALPTASMTGEG